MVVINENSDSENKHSNVRRRKEKSSIAKAVIERKRIDTEIQKKDQKLWTAQVEQLEKDAQRRHELHLLEIEDRRREAKNQAEEQRAEIEKRRKEAKQRTFQLQMQLAAM